jgi:hypothetical protein
MKKVKLRRNKTQRKMAFASYLASFGDKQGDPVLSTDERVLLGRVFVEHSPAMELDIGSAAKHIETVLHDKEGVSRVFAVRRVKQLDKQSVEACRAIARSEGMISGDGDHTLTERILTLQAVYAAVRLSLECK